MQTRNFLLKTSLLSIFFIGTVTEAISPALNDIGLAFPDVDPRDIQQLSPVTANFIVIFTIISGILATRVNRKALIYTGCVVELVAGAMQFFASSYEMVLFGRCLLGCGIGLLAPFAAGALVGDFFEGKEFHQMMGWGNASNNLGSMFTTFFGGILCAVTWRYTFLIHGLALFCIIFTAWGIPELPKPIIDRTGPMEGLWSRFKLHPYVWFAALGIAMGMFCQLQFAVNISMVLAADGLGNAAIAGYILTMSTVGCILGAMLYESWRHIFKNYIPVFAVTCQVLSFFMAYNAYSVWIFFVAVTIAGFGQGMFIPHIFARTSTKVRPDLVGFAYSVITVGINVGILSSVKILSMKVGPAIFGVGFGRPMWLLAGGILCGILLYWLIGIIIFDYQDKNSLERMKHEDLSQPV